jgi:hypothetical protein
MWSVIEADFQREYRIDLMREIGGMTWRRFNALLGGLSIDSRAITDLVNAENAPLTGEAAEEAFERYG